MEARFSTLRSGQRQATPRRWRRVLAVLISVAFALSFFHCQCFDHDDGAPTISIAQVIGDLTSKAPSDKAPAHPAPLHGDHCLTHLASVTPQEVSVAISYVAHGYRVVSMRSPDGTAPRSPFEPPRA